jgi:hypothetical protein
MPTWRAAALFEDAIEKRYLDSMLNNRVDRIVYLEDSQLKMKADYERLLENSRYVEIEMTKDLKSLQKDNYSYKEQLRQAKKKNLWQNIKFYTVSAALIVVSYFAITD